MLTLSPIAQRVVESILDRKIRPGERLGEQALAEHFSVSRTVVREALMQLQARGFVEVRPRSGWFVFAPSFDDALQTYAARRVIECAADDVVDGGRTDGRAMKEAHGFR